MKLIHIIPAFAVFLILGGAQIVKSKEPGHAGHEHHDEKSAHKNHQDHKEHDDHKAHDKHKGHDNHAGHGSHVDKVKLTNAQITELGIEITQGVVGTLSEKLVRPAVVKFDQERVAHIVPRVSGVVRKVFASEGDHVRAGDVIAIIESRELATAAAEYIARHKRLKLLDNLMQREEELKQKRISRLRDFLAVKTRHGEAEIELDKARHNLLALGLDKRNIAKILKSDKSAINEFNIVAPLTGTITDRHVVRGEFVSTTRQLFVIADMKNVWVDISVYPADLGRIRAGQKISISPLSNGGARDGKDTGNIPATIAFVSAGLNADTRTATARAVVNNDMARLSPGMFVSAEIFDGSGQSTLSVPESAIQSHEGKSVVFVVDGAGGADGNEFTARPIIVGSRVGGRATILGGLKAGDRFVSKGGFTLRAQLDKASFGDGHNH